MNDPHIIDREMILDYEHPQVGPMKTLGFPAKLSLTPGQFKQPAPSLGEHNHEVLEELGYESTDIEKLIKNTVIK